MGQLSDGNATPGGRPGAFVESRGRIVTSAPTRIDLAGGTLDIWPLDLFHPGAQTISAAISLGAHATVEMRSDSRIVTGL
jgi:hypothetical protein